MTEPSASNLKTENYRWDLSVLYSGADDPKINEDMESLEKMAKVFYNEHRGKLKDTLGKAISEYSEIDMLSEKIKCYLYLLESLDVSDSLVKAKTAEVREKMSHWFGEYLTFFRLELAAMDDVVLNKLYESNPVVLKHKPWIEYIRIFRPHFLSEPVESALTKRGPFGAVAWDDFFDEVEADLGLVFKGEKIGLTEALHILTESKDGQERAEMMELINKTLGGYFAKYSAQTLYVITGDHGVETKERGYKHPMDSENLSNRVTEPIVNALHKAVLDVAGPITVKYFRIKAAHLGLKKLKWSDRNAPLPFVDDTLTPFDNALETVLRAYESFSSTLADLIKKMIEKKRIDSPVTKNRRAGAYNSSFVVPGGKPLSFTFMNYLGSMRDVLTIAHELGHGVHGILAGEAQGPLMFSPPLAYCETASVFGEMTTFNFLKKELEKTTGDKKALLALLSLVIEENINTVVRQISFSNFERRVHGMNEDYSLWQEPKKLSVQELDNIWLKTTQELYGSDGDIFTYENTEHLWSYISHFHRPFYVYSYACGQLLTQSLYAQQERLGEQFEPLYLDLLRSGMTKDLAGLLKPFGLDPSDEKFWIDGINIGLGQMVEEFEKLSKEIGVV